MHGRNVSSLAMRCVRLVRVPLLLLLVCAATARAEDPIRAEDHIVLKSGQVLAGRVISTEKIHGKTFLVVDTPFGEMRIGDRSVSRRVEKPEDPDATVRIRRLRVVRIEGKIERQPAGGTDWFPVRWTDAYKQPIVNEDNAIIRPGDTIRTGPTGTIDFQPRKDIWIRVGKASLIMIPSVSAGNVPSFELRKGKALVDVEARSRGGTFRVRTPIATLSTRDGRFEAGASGAKVLRGTVGGKAERLSEEATRRYAYGKPILRMPRQDMCFVPAGRYRFGGKTPKGVGSIGGMPSSTKDLSFCEKFSYRIQHSFLIDRREFTTAQYRTWCLSHGRAVPFSIHPDTEHHPFTMGANPQTAASMLAWLGRVLPTEEQWEAAARGPRGRTFPWGDSVKIAEHSGLPITRGVDSRFQGPGTKVTPDDAKERWNTHTLLPVTAPTVDVSPFGVEAMVSGPGEWTASVLGNPVFRPHIHGRVDESRLEEPIIRGVMLQTSMRGLGGNANAGVRGVVVLKN